MSVSQNFLKQCICIKLSISTSRLYVLDDSFVTGIKH